MHIVMLCIAKPSWSNDPVTSSERQKLVVACHTLTLEKQRSPPPTRVCRLQCSTCEATRWPRQDCSIFPKWLRIITTYPDTNMPYTTMHPNHLFCSYVGCEFFCRNRQHLQHALRIFESFHQWYVCVINFAKAGFAYNCTNVTELRVLSCSSLVSKLSSISPPQVPVQLIVYSLLWILLFKFWSSAWNERFTLVLNIK